MSKYILIFLLACGAGTTTACSVWDFVKPSSGLEVSTEVTAGDKHQTVHTELGQTSTTNTADKIEIKNEYETSMWMTIMALIGWILPSPFPAGTWTSIKRKLPWNR